MRYTETTRTTAHLAATISAFLAGHCLVGRQAGGENPMEWLAGEFLAAADDGEKFEDWVCRQVVDILNIALRHDEIAPKGVHTGHCVYGVQLDDDDREHLLGVLGSHPEVQRKWREAHSGATFVA
jgi:hypothetical protein